MATSKESMDTKGETSASTSTSTLAGEQLAQTKRRMVDLNGTELPDPKRMRAEPDKNAKDNALTLLLHWHEYLFREFKMKAVENIDSIADLTGFIWTIHTKFRQESNKVGNLRTIITNDTEFTANGMKIKYVNIKETMKEIAEWYGFRYGQTEADKAATGTLGSYLALFYAFRSRFNEARVETTKVTLRKGTFVNAKSLQHCRIFKVERS